MHFLIDLWMPIVLSAVVVFVASSVIWMMTPLHKGDYQVPPDEAEIQGAVTKHGFKPGMYVMPWCKGGHGGMKDPEYLARVEKGPWVMVLVSGSRPSMGRCLGLWFASQVVIAVVVAYTAAAALPMRAGGAAYLKVFQVVGSMALLAQAGMAAHDTIWKCLGWRHTIVKVVDGVVYALLTAGVFAAMWPRT